MRWAGQGGTGWEGTGGGGGGGVLGTGVRRSCFVLQSCQVAKVQAYSSG